MTMQPRLQHISDLPQIEETSKQPIFISENRVDNIPEETQLTSEQIEKIAVELLKDKKSVNSAIKSIANLKGKKDPTEEERQAREVILALADIYTNGYPKIPLDIDEEGPRNTGTQEKLVIEIDEEKRKEESKAWLNSEKFLDIKEQARLMREERKREEEEEALEALKKETQPTDTNTATNIVSSEITNARPSGLSEEKIRAIGKQEKDLNEKIIGIASELIDKAIAEGLPPQEIVKYKTLLYAATLANQGEYLEENFELKVNIDEAARKRDVQEIYGTVGINYLREKIEKARKDMVTDD